MRLPRIVGGMKSEAVLTHSEGTTCTRCILGTADDAEITFDALGVCIHCHNYDLIASQRLKATLKTREELNDLVAEIKEKQKNQEFDVIIGVSGGVDSTYVAWLTKELGLRAMMVHLDNGWDSELAVKNIEQIVEKLDIELYTHVIDWEEFKDLQLSYLKASVVDIEALTDHAISAILYQIAARHKVHYILSGENTATEGILPDSWVHPKNDLMNIRGIHKRFGKIKIKTFPTLGIFKLWKYRNINRIHSISILDYIEYNKAEAKATITNELGWRDYGGKHYESVFTRFYQSYILPEKFGIDKRKSHLSTLICSGQMTRKEALAEMELPIIDPQVLSDDKEYVIKKWGLTPEEFEEYMNQPPRPHTDFPSILNIYKRLRPFKHFLFGKPKTAMDLSARSHSQRTPDISKTAEGSLKICMLLDNEYAPDYRVKNEIDVLLRAGHQVDLYCTPSNSRIVDELPPGLRVFRTITRDIYRPFSGKLRSFFKGFTANIMDAGYDVIHCHDIFTLLLGDYIKENFQKRGQSIKLVYDSHEYFAGFRFYERIENSFSRYKGMMIWRYVVRQEKKIIPGVDAIISVSQSICDRLSNYSGNKPTYLIRNLPPRIAVEGESSNYFQEYFGLSPDTAIMIHVGKPNFKKERLDQLVHEIRKWPDMHLVFLGSNDSLEEIKIYVRENRFDDIVHFHDQVPRDEITWYCSRADIGLVYFWNAEWESYQFALPNKLWDAAMAEIPLLVPGLTEMKNLIATYKNGACFEAFNAESLHVALKEILDKYDEMVAHASQLPKSINWDLEKQQLLDMYKALAPK